LILFAYLVVTLETSLFLSLMNLFLISKKQVRTAMLTDKIITNKFYLYKNVLHKVKKVQKKNNKVILGSAKDNGEIIIPLMGADLLLFRVYTIGEVAKIVERRSDTIRKYERSGLIPKPLVFEDEYPSYRNWRFYSRPDVYDIVEFFSGRTPGRPIKQKSESTIVSTKIHNLNEKVKMKARNI